VLSIDDRIAIRDLYARYCACLDAGDVDAWVQLWTEDGVFDTYQCSTGREAIHAYIRNVVAGRASKPWRNAQHWNNNLIVEGGGNEAQALCYLMHVGQNRVSSAFTINIQGMYEDELRRIDGRWLFKRRKVHFDTPPPSIIPARV
jgi:hypothetical protein